jgi:sortase A
MKTLKTISNIFKRIIPVIVVTAVLSAFGFGIYKLNQKYSSVTKELVITKENVPVFQKTLESIYADPVRIIISNIRIDAEIEPVGVAQDGALETPKVWINAGWYKKGASPGQEGNLLINAHYDDNFGRPAAFWQLKNVVLGDKVTVVDSYGRRYEYKVTEYKLVSINDPNRTDVFKSDESAKITLITCGGVWIPGKATYDKRLVVEGELIR